MRVVRRDGSRGAQRRRQQAPPQRPHRARRSACFCVLRRDTHIELGEALGAEGVDANVRRASRSRGGSPVAMRCKIADARAAGAATRHHGDERRPPLHLTVARRSSGTNHRVETSRCTTSTGSRDRRRRSWDTPRPSRTCPRYSDRTSTASPTSRRARPNTLDTPRAARCPDTRHLSRSRRAAERETPTTSSGGSRRSDRSDRPRMERNTPFHSDTRCSSRAARR